MSKESLNWGLLSTARINRAVIPPLRASKRNHLLAVASRSQELVDAYASEWEIPRAYGSYDDLLADTDINVIYNPLPNHLHAEWTVKAVEAGKHVLCEKPLALNVEEVDAIAGAAKTHSRVVAEAFMYRHHPQTLKIQEMVASGSLGTLKLLRGSFSFKLDRKGDIRLDPAMGGGSIWDVGCYPISYMRAVVGAEPVEVFGRQVTGPTGIDETFVGQLHFAEDIYGQFDCSFVIPFHSYMEIVGSEATLIVPKPFKPGFNEKIYLVRDEKTETMKIRGGDLYLGEVEDMADAILKSSKPRISLEDSRANVATITALLESTRTNKPVTIGNP